MMSLKLRTAAEAQNAQQKAVATQRQMQAMDVRASVQVSASAGTGKTHVLTHRFLRLLIEDAALKPSEILAVTYTKAGAMEMQNRIRAKLAAWVVAKEEQLAKELTYLLGRTPSAAEITRSRELFPLVLDDPLGLRVLTVHSFCQSLLGQFPLEAGVNAAFNVLEEEEAKTLLAEQVQNTYLHFAQLAESAKNSVDAPKAWVLAYLVQQLADSTLQDEFKFFTDNRSRFEKLFANTGGLEGALAALEVALGLNVYNALPQTTFEQINTQFFTKLHAYGPWFKTLAAALSADKGVKAQEKAAALNTLTASFAPPNEKKWEREVEGEVGTPLQAAYSIFFKDDGEPYKNFVPAGVKKALPHLEAEVTEFVAFMAEYQGQLASAKVYFKTAAFLTLAAEVSNAYARAKEEQNKLDFEDLIRLSKALLTTDYGLAQWVRYKMDGRIAHILLDEAQDTDSDQWAIIKALMEDFFTGAGQRENTLSRTFFAVGDGKQAIYRFRGAERHIFENMHTEIASQGQAVGHHVKFVELETSFRSVSVVLQTVDLFFKDPKLYEALGATGPLQHGISHYGKGGQVHLLPLPEPLETQKQQSQGWQLPFKEEGEEDHPPQTNQSPGSLLKEQHFKTMAATIAALIDEAPFLGLRARRLTPGDVLILLRSNKDVHNFLRALAEAGVTATRQGKLTLAESPVIQDCVAFLKFLANPLDDAALLHTLRAPFFIFDDVALETLRCGAGNFTKEGRFFKALRQTKGFEGVAALLEELLTGVDYTTPHQLMLGILQRTQGVGRFMQRYAGTTTGPMADDLWQTLDAFLEAALAYSRRKNASLTGFLQWFAQSGLTLQLQPGSSPYAVKVMTIHGSKGLQAPVVVMPEVGADIYLKFSKEQHLWQVDPNTGEDALFLFGLSQKEGQPPLQLALKEAEKSRIFSDEMRLMYVALTRAEERLIIGASTAAKNSWYTFIKEQCQGTFTRGEGGVLSLCEENLFENTPPNLHPSKSMQEDLPPLPAWVTAPPAGGQTLAIVTAQGEGFGEPPSQYFERGLIVHRLLEVLSSTPKAQWLAKATAFLHHRAGAFSPEERLALQTEAFGVLTTFEEYLGQAQTELTLAALEKGHVFKGRVDALKVTQNSVIITDFKTERTPPKQLPKPYQAQLQRYKDLAQKIWPQKRVVCAVVWTATCEIMWLGGETL